MNLDLGNAAETNMVAINAAHIAHVKLTSTMSSVQRKMDIYLANGAVISMNFERTSHAEKTFVDVIDTISRTIPDHPSSCPEVPCTVDA